MNEHGPGLRPIAVIAGFLLVAIGVPLIIDLIRFAGREAKWRKFDRTLEGEFDDRLRGGWVPEETDELRGRLIRSRPR